MNPKISFYCLAELMSDHLRSARGYGCRIFIQFLRLVGWFGWCVIFEASDPKMRSHNDDLFGPDDE